MTIVLLLLGMAMLLAGGRLLVEAAVGVAGRMGVPALLVGLTLVAWGTSAPELALNFAAAVRERPDLVFGNIVGANICNIGLVLGLCALVRPLVCETSVVRREMPITLAFLGGMTLLVLVPTPDPWHFSRLDGGVLLVAFFVYSIATIRSALRGDDAVSVDVAPVEREQKALARRPVWMLALLFVAGIVLLTLGGNVAADAASDLARQLGMSEKTIGLTVVAVGTTLPELATSVMAIRAGQVDLAVGNALGSCIFNTGLIFGVTVLIAPSTIPDGGLRSLLVMVALAVALLVMSRTRVFGRLGRVEGFVLLAIYVGATAHELILGSP